SKYCDVTCRERPAFSTQSRARRRLSALSLHDALPISSTRRAARTGSPAASVVRRSSHRKPGYVGLWRTWEPAATSDTSSKARSRSEEHTSELQSRGQLVCRLLLEKKKHPSMTSTPGHF